MIVAAVFSCQIRVASAIGTTGMHSASLYNEPNLDYKLYQRPASITNANIGEEMPHKILQTFDSIEEFNSFNSGWDVEFSSVACGNIRTTMEHLATKHLVINIATTGASTIQRGSTPPGMQTFAFPLAITGAMSWRNIRVSTNSLMTFPKNGELFAVANGPMHICTLSIDNDLIEHRLAASEDQPLELVNSGRAIEMAKTHSQRLKQKLQMYTKFVELYDHHGEHGVNRNSLESALVADILDLLMYRQVHSRPIRQEAAARNTRRALEYMEATKREPITIATLCNTTGISRRVLELSFRKYTGVSPKQFNTQMRMMGCHRELKKCSHHETSVKQIALDWGFWHMGKFGQDYKRLWGQTPGTTLRDNSSGRLTD